MIDDIDKLEILKEEEVDRQQKIDSFKNYDFTSIQATNSDEKLAEQQQNEDDEVILRRGHDSSSDHGSFIAHDDDYYQVLPPPTKKRKAVMAAQCEIMEENDDGGVHKELSGTLLETYEEYKETQTFSEEEVNYEAEFENYTYDATTMYWSQCCQYVSQFLLLSSSSVK